MLESAVCEVNRHMELGDVIIVFRRPGPAGWRWQRAAHALLCHLEEKYGIEVVTMPKLSLGKQQ